MKHLRDKLSETTALIMRVMREYQRPAVMWSSGKDSMVLLFILRHMKLDLPVIFHREPFFPRKYEFADQMIRDWNLTCYDWPPMQVAMQEAGGVVEIVNHYQTGPARFMALPKNLYESEPDAKWSEGKTLCGLKHFLERPRGGFIAPWDIVFHGHKSSDVDPLLGSVPLHVDVKQNIGCPSIAFPLRRWTDKDIWDYTNSFQVPQQETRYKRGTGEELEDKTLNPDYWSCCTRCLDRHGPRQVFCPRLAATVDNISSQVGYVEPLKMDYFGQAPTTNREETQHAV